MMHFLLHSAISRSKRRFHARWKNTANFFCSSVDLIDVNFRIRPWMSPGGKNKEEESMYRRAKVTHVQQHFNVLYQPYRVVSFCLSY